MIYVLCKPKPIYRSENRKIPRILWNKRLQSLHNGRKIVDNGRKGYKSVMTPGGVHRRVEFSPGGLTFWGRYAIFPVGKGCDEDMPVRKAAQRGAGWWEGSATLPDRIPLLSCGEEMLRRVRPLMRQWVTAAAVTRVEPWNTFVSHPWSSGGGYFLYLSPK